MRDATAAGPARLGASRTPGTDAEDAIMVALEEKCLHAATFTKTERKGKTKFNGPRCTRCSTPTLREADLKRRARRNHQRHAGRTGRAPRTNMRQSRHART